MNRELLAHLPVVVAVAEQRGFAAAAQVLGMSASAVSHAVRVVEDSLGEPLFARTTRSVALTEAGQRFLDGVAPALDDITQAVEHLSAARGEVSSDASVRAVDDPHRPVPTVSDELGAATRCRRRGAGGVTGLGRRAA